MYRLRISWFFDVKNSDIWSSLWRLSTILVNFEAMDKIKDTFEFRMARPLWKYHSYLIYMSSKLKKCKAICRIAFCFVARFILYICLKCHLALIVKGIFIQSWYEWRVVWLQHQLDNLTRSNGDVVIVFFIISRIIEQIMPGPHSRWPT